MVKYERLQCRAPRFRLTETETAKLLTAAAATKTDLKANLTQKICAQFRLIINQPGILFHLETVLSSYNRSECPLSKMIQKLGEIFVF